MKKAWKNTAWRVQVSCLKFYTDKPGGIWVERVTRRERNPQVTDKDLKPNAWARAVRLTDRLMNRLPMAKQNALPSRLKWRAVDLVAAGDLNAAMDVLGL